MRAPRGIDSDPRLDPHPCPRFPHRSKRQLDLSTGPPRGLLPLPPHPCRLDLYPESATSYHPPRTTQSHVISPSPWGYSSISSLVPPLTFYNSTLSTRIREPFQCYNRSGLAQNPAKASCPTGEGCVLPVAYRTLLFPLTSSPNPLLQPHSLLPGLEDIKLLGLFTYDSPARRPPGSSFLPAGLKCHLNREAFCVYLTRGSAPALVHRLPKDSAWGVTGAQSFLLDE